MVGFDNRSYTDSDRDIGFVIARMMMVRTFLAMAS
jgi:hypothetical protein